MALRARTVAIDGLDRWHELRFSSSGSARLADVLTTRPPEAGDEATVSVDDVTVLEGLVRSVLPVRQVWRVRIEPEGSLRRRGHAPDRVGPSSWRRLSIADVAAEIWGDQVAGVGAAGEVRVDRFSLPPSCRHNWAAAAVLRHLGAAGIAAPAIAVDADGRWRMGSHDDLVRRGAWSARPTARDGVTVTFKAGPVAAIDEIEMEGGGSIVAAAVTTLESELLYRTEVVSE
ncbi:MAG: hypothetical protein OXC31_26555 [Spirochaetaceae bacterium]|nr:hypothetical protein [Spirochaetaceae bacterium]